MSTLQEGFEKRGLHDKGDLVRKLLGSPALVANLPRVAKEVAVDGYVAALKTLFTVGSALAAVMVLFQAGTGWGAPEEKEVLEDGP